MDQIVKQKKKKQARLVVLVVLFLFVPLAVAGVILALNLNGNLNNGVITSVTLVSQENTWELKGEDIEFFTQVVQGGSEIHETADPLDEYRHLTLTFHKLKVDLSYELLFSDSVNNCLYIDPDGVLHLIPAETAAKLLVHPRITGVALSFANAPTCAVAVNGEETPTGTYAGEWTFTNVDDTMTTLTLDEKGEKKAVLPAGEALQLAFSIQPDFCSIRILDKEENLLYSGAPEEMELLSFEDDTSLKLTVSAEWYETLGITYRGKIDYEFDLDFDVPTLCTLSRSYNRPGDVFEIRVEHSSSENVAVTASFPTGQITTERNGKALVIRVPVAESASANDYTITLLGSDVDESFEVSILPAIPDVAAARAEQDKPIHPSLEDLQNIEIHVENPVEEWLKNYR